MIRTFTDRTSGKTWTAEQIGSSVITSSNGGKPKEKTLDSPREAKQHARKEAWSRLKKGFVLHNPEAAAGEPAMHLYYGGAYTGSMPIAPIRGANSVCCAKTEKSGEAEISLVDSAAGKERIHELPEEGLLFDMLHVPELESLLLNFDHRIFTLPLGSGGMKPYTTEADIPASVMSLAGTSVLWFDNTRLVVHDLATGQERFSSIPAKPEQYGGHTPQMSGALSRDGSRMAYSAASGEIVVVELKSGEQRVLPKTVSTLTADMAFAPDGRYLFTLDEYAYWGLRCYDLNAMEECIGRSVDGARGFAIHERNGLLAVYERASVTLIDLASGEPRMTFEVEHAIKNCNMAFTEDYLGVYTDYGCVSLYALPE